MQSLDFNHIPIEEQKQILFSRPNYVNPESVRYKINADYLKFYAREECYRELLVSYLPMLPLLEKTVHFEEADYILYMHMYARCDDMSDWVAKQLQEIAEHRKEGAEIIVVGKAANAEKLLNGSISNITFWGDHFAEKLGKKFGFDIKEQYFVYDEKEKHLAIWPVDGCLQKCKFCRRSYMDIKFESLSLDVIKQQLDFIQAHAPELLLTISLRAENLTEYGIDIYGKQMLHELIQLIASYPEVKQIKIPIGLSIGEITPEILDAMCSCNKLVDIAMNLEAGTDRLLKVLGKKHTCEQAIHVFTKLREALPGLKINSTVMIGLPTEGFDDIWGLANLIGKTQPDNVLCNIYASSPRHPLAKLPQISHSLSEYHLRLLLDWIRYTVRRELTFKHEYIYKRPKSRRARRAKAELKSDNAVYLQHGLLPRYHSHAIHYTV